MKKNLLAVCCIAILWVGCKSKDEPTPQSMYYMTAKINGQAWAGQTSGFFTPELDLTDGPIAPYTLSGFGSDSRMLFTMNAKPKVGKYTLVAAASADETKAIGSYSPAFFTNQLLGPTYDSESGELNITKIDTVNSISEGTFYFTTKDENGNSIQIMEGAFRAKVLK